MGPKLHEQQTQSDTRLANILQKVDHLGSCESLKKSNNSNNRTACISLVSTKMLNKQINVNKINHKNLAIPKSPLKTESHQLLSKCSGPVVRLSGHRQDNVHSDNNVKRITHILDPTNVITKTNNRIQTTSYNTITNTAATKAYTTNYETIKFVPTLKQTDAAFLKISSTNENSKIVSSKLLVNSDPDLDQDPDPYSDPNSHSHPVPDAILNNDTDIDNNYYNCKLNTKMPAEIVESAVKSETPVISQRCKTNFPIITEQIRKSTTIMKLKDVSKPLNEFSNTITNLDHHNRRRRRGRLRPTKESPYREINLSMLLLVLTSLSSMLLSPMVSLSKLYRYVNNVLASKRLANNLKLITGILVVTTILPINLVNAAPSSPISRPSSSSSAGGKRPIGANSDLNDKPLADIGGSDGLSNFGFSNEREFFFPSQSDENFDEEDNDSFPYATSSNKTFDNATHKAPLFPKDLFTQEQLENGAVICHIIGVIYMFVALAIVCDEFFVPALDVIIEKLDITDDVAGATFMAAGGSAPELFTSVIGVFVSFDDVGIGTIVGSAVFNILFVIGMCALFSKTLLTLTWWPLFRDCSFYSISLIVLIYFFRDNLIYWWEALILFSIYVAYVGFMKWNQQVERCVKKVIYQKKVTRVRSTDQLMPAGNAANSSETSMATQPGGSMTSRAASESRSGPAGSSTGATGNSSGSTQTGAKFRHGLLQLMIHTIDPLHDDDVPGKVDEKATQLHAIASLKVLLDATKPHSGGATTSAANHVKINLKETTLVGDRPNGNIDTTLDSGPDIEDVPEALSMAWPTTGRKRLTYLLVAPIVFPLWLTLPDTKTPRGKRFYPVTFIGSIVWIAAYSYLMVWWANVAGDTAKIPPEVMGLTFLAAGTSIPDLITSVIVARKGFGDMAVSSSVGSNIFDVTVGLPIPWLLYGIIYDAPVEVNSVGMVCSITILFMMLIFVVISIACFRWRMNKGLGFTMFLLYFVFVAVSLLFEYDVITCPV